MADSSIYGSTRELMAATDSLEKASGGHSFKRRGLLSRQKSSLSFDMGAKKIEQVRKRRNGRSKVEIWPLAAFIFLFSS